MAAAVELPRRLASTQGALAGLYPFKLLDLARALAEPALLGRGLQAWAAGHDALLAARLLEGPHDLFLSPDLPRAPVALVLARTLSSLRAGGLVPEQLEDLAGHGAGTPEDGARLWALARLYRRFHEAIEGRLADSVTIFHEASARVADASWLKGAQALLVDDLELDATEQDFLEAIARALPVHLLERSRPQSLQAASFAAWAAAHGIQEAPWSETPLAVLEPAPPPAALQRVRAALFEPPAGGDGTGADCVELVTAPSEAAEVRAIVRRLLREAANGTPFEEMGVILPRPEDYAPLFTDLLSRIGIPYRLHPSLPLRFGRSARSLLLLFRCRGLSRAAVLEFLTFAPIPFAALLGGEAGPPAQWDAISREAGIVSGLDRWSIGLRAHAGAEREAAEREAHEERRSRRLRRAADADTLLRVVEELAATLDTLAGRATWPEWSERLGSVCARWLDRERDREAVNEVVADLAGLSFTGADTSWEEVERVVEARFEWERLPLEQVDAGSLHVGALDAMAGVPFRVVAIPGLVEGGYPPTLRPDPFLLDPEREALGAAASSPHAAGRSAPGQAADNRQLALFVKPAGGRRLPTTQDRLLAERRLFQRAIGQAKERLVLSYPRADARSGRERLPSLFFVAVASAREGRSLDAGELATLVHEDDLDALEPADALDAAERDRLRMLRGGHTAAESIAAGSPFFRQSRLACEARWSSQVTPYDGLIAYAPRDGESEEVAAALRRRLDPVGMSFPISASRLATFSKCGFMYMLRHVLHLEPALEPAERRKLEPLERGNLFHQVAERFLRERREKGELPVRDMPETQARLHELGDAALDAFVAGSPPRFTLLWQRERSRFHETMRAWLGREAAGAERATPAHFEVGFGLPPEATSEPHSPEPLEIDLGDGRTLRVSGKIDRIDARSDGRLVLRDYKTGRAPRDDGGIFRGGQQLQIPFYVLAAARLFPDHSIAEAFLDYVDGGRQVALDPALVHGEGFRSLLRGLVDAIAQGWFLQEPAACTWCDYVAVCGPQPLVELRRRYKIRDPRLQTVLRLRDIG